MNARGLLLIGATLLAGAAPAVAQAPSASASPSASPSARAPVPRASSDNVSIWTVQGENDSVGGIGNQRNSDKYYTNGLRLGWTSPPRLVPETLKGLAQTLWGAGDARLSVDISQMIYTANNTRVRNPARADRPYAGVLMANFGLTHDGTTQTGLDTRSSMTLGLGMVGPSAGGRVVQNGFHDLIGIRPALGWSGQLKNEPLLQITSERVWRVPMVNLGPLETDAVPSLTAAVGNLRVYLQTGAIVRIGQGLNADFGPSAMRPSLSGGDYHSSVRPLAWYVFLGAAGRGVAHDLTLDGNTFTTSRSVKKKPIVGELLGGVAILAHGMRLSYTHTLISQEFRGQRGGLQQTGTLALSVRF